MSLSCCRLPAVVLAGLVSKHARTLDAGSIWATDVPAWIGTLATVGLLIGAIITAMYAIKAFRTQSEQLADQRKISERQTEVLELQATELRESLDERERQAVERRRAQAVNVYIGLPLRGIRLVQPSAQNASSLPVFDAQFWYSGPDGLSDPMTSA